MGSRCSLHHVTSYATLTTLYAFFTTLYTCYSNPTRFPTITYDDLDTTRTSATTSQFNDTLVSPTSPLFQSSGYRTSTWAGPSLSKDSGSRTVRFYRDRIYYSTLRSRDPSAR